jgi:uncharacterized protein (DUF433 family)
MNNKEITNLRIALENKFPELNSEEIRQYISYANEYEYIRKIEIKEFVQNYVNNLIQLK